MKRYFKLFKVLLLMCGVFAADEDEIKSMAAMEGDSVTLSPDPAKIQGFKLILWRFGDPVIAQIDGNDTSYPRHTEIFRDRLQLDQKGSLTIKNMRIKHSGLYKIKVMHSTGTSNMKFIVTVYESPFVVDAGEAEIKSMLVEEGDFVVLQTDVPQLSEDELIVWRFGDQGKLIAKHDIEAKSTPLYYETNERFRDRLKLDQTGSLTITDTRNTDSGLYTAKISSNKQTLYKRFTVTVRGSDLSLDAVAGIVFVVLLVAAAAFIYKIADIQEKVSEMEGDDVILNSGVTKIKRGDAIEWRSGNEDVLIAEIKKTSEITTYDAVLYGIFRGRLKLDMNTGSLTITNSRIVHTGLYQLLINNKYEKRFIVYIRVKSLSAKEKDPVTLKTNTEIQKGEEIRWLFGSGDALIAQMKGKTKEISVYDDVPDARFRDRLELDKENGSLTITDITTDCAGLYKLLMLSRGRTMCRKFFVYVKSSTESQVNE